MSVRILSSSYVARGLLAACCLPACATAEDIDAATLQAVRDQGLTVIGGTGTSTASGSGTTAPSATTTVATSVVTGGASATATDTGAAPTQTAPEATATPQATLPAGGAAPGGADTSGAAGAADTSGGTGADTSGSGADTGTAPTDGAAAGGAGGAGTLPVAPGAGGSDLTAGDTTGAGGAGTEVDPGGAGGTVGAGEGEEPAPVSDMVCEAPQALLDITDLTVYYAANNTSAMGNIAFRFGLSTTSVDRGVELGDLKVRYWYVSEGNEFDWISDSQSQPLFQEGQMRLVTAEYGERADGQEYIEFSFPEKTLTSSNAESAQVQVRFQPDAISYDQSEHWSFAGSSMFTPNDKMTAYFRGCLIWGEEPN